MPSNQAIKQKERRDQGVCYRCGREVFNAGQCFRCTLARKFAKRGLTGHRKRTVRAWELFVNGMSARYARILNDEGFAVDALRDPENIIGLARLNWAKGRLRKKVLEVISEMDDHAIRRRFS